MRLLSYFYSRAESQYKQRCRVSSFSLVGRLRLARPGNLGSNQAGEKVCLFSTAPRQLWDPHSLLFYGLLGNTPPVVKCPKNEATPSPRTRMHECKRAFPQTSIWRGSCAYTCELEHITNT